LERTFAASPEDVFDAWTNPMVLQRWWAVHPDGDSPGCDVDLRVGGRYVLRMRHPGGDPVTVVAGEYREIDRPRRLVYTWAWEAGPHAGHSSVVAIQFVPVADGTTVLLEQSGFATELSRQRHGDGWTAALDNLARRIFNQSRPSGSGRGDQPNGGPNP
jgi:glutathione S-transferase